jgi:hypothetical protein
LFDEGFEYGDGAKFSCYIGTDAEPLCVELCKFAQYHTFVNCLAYYYMWYNSFQYSW